MLEGSVVVIWSKLAIYLHTASSRLLSLTVILFISGMVIISSLDSEQGLKICFILEELLLEKGCIYFLFLLQVLSTSIVNHKVVGGFFYQLSLSLAQEKNSYRYFYFICTCVHIYTAGICFTQITPLCGFFCRGTVFASFWFI